MMSSSNLGIQADSTGVYANQNGSYALTVGAGTPSTSITIVGTGSENKSDGSAVEVTVGYNATNNSFTYSDNL